MSLHACVNFPRQDSEIERSLDWCPPLPNCVSTEASTFFHHIKSFELAMPLKEAWPLIRESVSELPNTSITHESEGYIYAKSYSAVFHFLDYFEVLSIKNENHLSVRSSSLLGLSDFFINYFRSEKFRTSLLSKDVIHQ
ncbi:MAG: hypothetical protein ACI8O8_002678 [Oleiphilaceae bacterium]|jgi:uncharacterized protein (DUF1499 family)